MTDAHRRWLNRALRWLLGLVFVLAAVGVPDSNWAGGKVGHPSRFAKNIRTYKMLPQPLVFPMAVYLPWLELVAGLTLLTGVWKREALTVSLLLCGTFLLANATALVRGLEIDCGCFGPGYHGSAGREALIAVGMLVTGVVALWVLPRSARSDNARVPAG